MSQSKPIIIQDVKPGDIFSEISHYKLKDTRKGDSYEFEHLESSELVSLNTRYVQNLLTTADQFFETREVGKEDKKDGTPGIRSIWEDIHSAEVFTVSYRKQDTPLSTAKLKTLREDQIRQAVEEIEKAQKNKKGVATTAFNALKKIQENPINAIEPGELRTLRGYKTQYESRDGRYNCVDMDLVQGSDISKAIRPVNINTIESLVFKGVRYIVK